MMDFIQKFLRPQKIDRKIHVDYFFSLPEHSWIISGDKNCKSLFEELISYLPSSLIKKITVETPISFVLSEDFKSNPQNSFFKNTIVVFPEFQKLIKSKKRSAIAYLAHEIALTLLELEGDEKESFLNEVEADKFVSDLGLIQELEEFLLMLDESMDKRMRLTYLTLNHLDKLEE